MSFHSGGICGGKMQGHLASKQNMSHACILVSFLVASEKLNGGRMKQTIWVNLLAALLVTQKLSYKGKEVFSIKHVFNACSVIKINTYYSSSTISTIMPYTDADHSP